MIRTERHRVPRNTGVVSENSAHKTQWPPLRGQLAALIIREAESLPARGELLLEDAVLFH
jgi:hypothetical protein